MGKTTKKETLSDIINRRRMDVIIRQGYISLIFRILFLIIFAWFLLTQMFQITQMNGQGMFPAVKDGDLLIGFRLQDEYAKNDVAICTVDGKQYVGRIIACEGDVVTLDESGKLLVNGTAQSGEVLYPTYAVEGITYPYRVPEEHVFLLGDYRTRVKDSRNFGPVSMNNVEAKVITILRRRSL